MQWLNYHHLRYFWTVAKEGSLRRAADRLHISQPSISAQIRELEEALGEKLFRRSGRTNVLTDAGQLVFGYADEIFALGRELVNAIQQRPTSKEIRLQVGVVDAFPKLVALEILKPVFAMPRKVHMICREGKVEDLLAQLAAHRLDIVLADEPSSSGLPIKTFNQLLGECGLAFCALPQLAARLAKDFPRSLDGQPAMLPAENTSVRRALENWFHTEQIRPRVVAEFEDLALMSVMAGWGRGFIVVPSIVLEEAVSRYKLRVVGTTNACRQQFYAITAERRINHPAVMLMTNSAQKLMADKNGRRVTLGREPPLGC